MLICRTPEPTAEATVARAAELALSPRQRTDDREILSRTAQERIGEIDLALVQAAAHALVVGERVRYPRTPEPSSGAAPT